LLQRRVNRGRRRAIALLALPIALSVSSYAPAHTPYGQWRVYRRKHLLIGCHKRDPATYELAGELVDILQAHLPEARARIARAPTSQRLASLMGTDQLDVAIIDDRQAQDMASGSNDFKAYGEIQLRSLALLPEHTLVCRAAIPDRHAWLIAASLVENMTLRRTLENPPLPWHQGASLYLAGAAVPD